MTFHLTQELFKKCKITREYRRYLYALENTAMQHYDWKPYRRITLKEAEQFLQQDVGMVPVEADADSLRNIESIRERHPNMNYVCSYTFPNTENMRRWMLRDEKEFDNLMVKYEKELLESSATHSDSEAYEREKRTANINRYTLLYLYSEDGIHFDDMDAFGNLPMIVECCLLHLLGKAPTPDETYSNWTIYLKFLIDIGYVQQAEDLKVK